MPLLVLPVAAARMVGRLARSRPRRLLPLGALLRGVVWGVVATIGLGYRICGLGGGPGPPCAALKGAKVSVSLS